MLLRRALFRSTTALRPSSLVTVRGVQTTQPTITKPNVPGAPNVPASTEMTESVEAAEKARYMQAPNRASTWSKSQRPRDLGMVGPRFEQTIISQQPAPYAAIGLIHQQPVRWSEKRVVACDGGGGPHGHPRVFINVDKPEVTPCGYCGLPFAHVKNRKHLLETGAEYPLE